jgi:NAD-dependent SIR2 family protein deacetylase
VLASGLHVSTEDRPHLRVEINLGPTEITDMCDVAIHDRASRCLPLLADRVLSRVYAIH